MNNLPWETNNIMDPECLLSVISPNRRLDRRKWCVVLCWDNGPGPPQTIAAEIWSIHKLQVFLDPRGSTREEKLVEQGKWVTPRSKWSCWETLKYRARMCALCQSLNTYKQRQHTHFKASTNSRHTWNEVQQMTCRVESLTLLQIFHHWDKHLLHKAQGCTAQRPSEALTYTLKVSVLIWSLNENMQICSNK